MVFLFLSSVIPIIAATAVTKEGVKAIDRSARRALPERRQQQGIGNIGNINVKPINIGKPININVQGILNQKRRGFTI